MLCYFGDAGRCSEIRAQFVMRVIAVAALSGALKNVWMFGRDGESMLSDGGRGWAEVAEVVGRLVEAMGRRVRGLKITAGCRGDGT